MTPKTGKTSAHNSAPALAKQTRPMNPPIGPTDAKIAAGKGSKIQGKKR